MNLNSFNYYLPVNLIAQQAIHPRHTSRMMVVERGIKKFSNYHFYDFPDFLHPGDVIVINDTRVVKSVLTGLWENGGQIQIKMVSRKSIDVWDCLVESVIGVSEGDVLYFCDNTLIGTVEKRNWCDTGWLIKFHTSDGSSILSKLDKYGKLFIPLHLPQKLEDEESYQTVYAKKEGSLQPPTAGLHFTDKILSRVKENKNPIVTITQHVGRLDNRLPADNVEQHKMYEEFYEVSEDNAKIINQAKGNGHKIIAIGTTVTRTLETATDEEGFIHAGSGWSNLYIYPGYKFKLIDGLLTNFQSPQITTLILACAFGGTDLIMDAYRDAVTQNYRFLEFGDCIFIH